MHIDIMLALHSNLKKDYSQKNQYRQTDLLQMILEINQDVICHGIGILEDYENKTMHFPLLYRGLKLVRNGVEPQDIESILLHMAFANNVDLLESLLVIEGVGSIQTLRSPDLTKELLFSYFHFSVQDHLRKRLQHFKLKCCEVLNNEEVEMLLKDQEQHFPV